MRFRLQFRMTDTEKLAGYLLTAAVLLMAALR